MRFVPVFFTVLLAACAAEPQARETNPPTTGTSSSNTSSSGTSSSGTGSSGTGTPDTAVVSEPMLHDVCKIAMQSDPLSAGTYYFDELGFDASINPGVGRCTGSSLPGEDAMVPVIVPADGTLTATVEMPDGDPALYLLYVCDDRFSCPRGSNIESGPLETLSYQNPGTQEERMYLVIDTATELRPFHLTLAL